jgi:23S rRNA pseudouridine1911/1915/1917 synthase
LATWFCIKTTSLSLSTNLPAFRCRTTQRAINRSLALGSIYTQSKLQVIHRLDRPASGVVLFAKTHNALVALNEQFRNRQIRKTYLAVVQEMPPEPEGELKHFVGKKSAAKTALKQPKRKTRN